MDVAVIKTIINYSSPTNTVSKEELRAWQPEKYTIVSVVINVALITQMIDY